MRYFSVSKIKFFFANNSRSRTFLTFFHSRVALTNEKDFNKRKLNKKVWLLTCSDDGDGQLSGKQPAKPGSKLDGRFLIRSNGTE